MKRTATYAVAMGLFVLGLVAVGAAPARAQGDPLAGVTVEALSSGTPADTGGRALLLLRVTMEPGAAIIVHRHPGPVALAVETGTFGTSFIEGEGQITRAAADGTPVATEPASAGNDYVLNPGDSLYYDGAAHTMVNAGDDTLVLLVAALFDPAQPGFIFLAGTPTP